MTHEELRELRVLSDAEAPALLGKYYSFKKEPELAATARRLARDPAPRMLEVVEKSMAGGPAVHVVKICESGKARLRELRLKQLAGKR